MENKTCNKCKVEKILNVDNFAKYKDKWRSECRSCSAEMCRQYKARNKQKISEYNKTYKTDNKVQIDAYNKKYYWDNWDEIQEKTKQTHKRLRETDPKFKISQAMRNRVRKLLTRENKSQTTMDLLGCDVEFFIKWLEFQFKEGMSMDNYGTWHLDHVTPCASFDMTIPFHQRQCFHWTNYQPLFAMDNVAKSAKILKDEIDKHEEKVLEFVDKFGEILNLKYTLYC